MSHLSDSGILAIAIFLVYALLSQWTFRCQRVGRGLLLLARDTAAGHPSLFSAIMPTRFVNLTWVKRIAWLACAYFAWKAWSSWGLALLLGYGLLLGAWIDTVSPWPSYSTLLGLIKDRIRTGRAGVEAFTLGPAINEVEKAMAAGIHFEKATTGRWINRAVEAADRTERTSLVDPGAEEPEG